MVNVKKVDPQIEKHVRAVANNPETVAELVSFFEHMINLKKGRATELALEAVMDKSKRLDAARAMGQWGVYRELRDLFDSTRKVAN